MLENFWFFTQMAYSSTYDYAYPTSVTTPVPDSTGVNGSNTSFTTSTVYDYNTGLPTSTTDINGQTTSMEYVDPLLRPTKVTAPNGHQTITEYGAGTSGSTRWVKSRSQIDANTWKEAFTGYDGLGRTTRSQSVDAATGDVFVDTQYDNMGRTKKSTNPYRSGDVIYWTENTFDTAGRLWKSTTPDSAFVETLYSLSTSGDIGTVVTVKDQALKERRSITNALGQLKRVDEPTVSGLGAVSAPNQPTSYAYDLLNSLTSVTQGLQTRSFTYDSMSRLKSANNPESGIINYTYDANSNLATKIDARPITTTYAYDALNRVKTRSYNDGVTPQVTYFYDNLSNAKGKLTKVSSSVSTTDYTSFDILGRVTAHKQTTDGTAYTTGYTYNLGGTLIEETYPSGRVVKNTLDPTGDLSMVQSKKNAASGFFSYADAFTYNAAGAVTSMQLGNGKWESTQFNSRLQPTQIALGQTQNATNLLDLDYTYGTTQNNGNVLTQDITVARTGQSPLIFNQTYIYDSLNRLQVAEEKTGMTTNWKQTYSFDRYGNRNLNQSQTTFPSFSNPNVTNPSINTANNRFNGGQGYSFDAAGNVTADAEGRTFVYDAENKQTSVSNGGGPIGQYWFDGDGRRVKKVVPSSAETTIFVYDAGGKLVAEYSTNVVPQTTAKVQYLTNDNLGTPRINTDKDGNVTSRTDYMPYGEEIIALGGRSSTDKYVADDVRQGFTGYINDDETGLDFAQARMYAKSLGRFSGADPYAIILQKGKGRSAKERKQLLNNYILNPQVWNKYAYVLNNPLAMIDQSGNCSVPAGLKPGQTGICVEAFIAARVLLKAGGLSGGFGDGRKPSGTDATLTNRVQVDLIISKNDNGTFHYAWNTKTNYSIAWVGPIILPPAKGTTTTSVTNAVSESDGTSRLTLSVTSLNGYSANGLPGPSDIQFDFNIVKNPNGTVDFEGGAAKTFPTIAIYGYTMDAAGNVTTKEVKVFPEQSPEDLEKPKQPIPAATPQ